MRKLPAVLVAFVLLIHSAFSVYPAVDFHIDAENIQNKKVIKSSVVIESDSAVVSGEFVLRYDNSVALLREVSCPDFYLDTLENDGVITVVFTSKGDMGVTNSEIKFEFDRLSAGDLSISFDKAECVDNTKNSCSVSTSGVTITIADNAIVEDSFEGDFALDTASQDSLDVKNEGEHPYKLITLFVCGIISIIVIVVLLIKEQKELRQSK